MAGLDEFADIIKRNEPLAPYLFLKMGGPAEMLVQPRSARGTVALRASLLSGGSAAARAGQRLQPAGARRGRDRGGLASDRTRLHAYQRRGQPRSNGHRSCRLRLDLADGATRLGRFRDVGRHSRAASAAPSAAMPAIAMATSASSSVRSRSWTAAAIRSCATAMNCVSANSQQSR